MNPPGENIHEKLLDTGIGNVLFGYDTKQKLKHGPTSD